MEVQTYESATAFLDVAPKVEAGCVITDVRMPELSGIDLLRRLRELKLGMPVIVITGHGDVPLAVEAMKIGALDFLEKPFDDEVLLASVRSALNQLDQDQKRQAERSEIEGRLATLSNRERDVLEGLVAGHANKQIAYDLGISPRTIEIYRANLMTKMQAASLSDLVRMALIAGILGPDSERAEGARNDAWPPRAVERPSPRRFEPDQSGAPVFVLSVSTRSADLRVPAKAMRTAERIVGLRGLWSSSSTMISPFAIRSKFSLEIEGFTVHSYATGTELLGAGDLSPCDCLVVDQKMPGMSGLDLIALLRDRHFSAPAILITSDPSPSLRERARKAAVPIVEKPLLGNALLEQIRDVVGAGRS